MRTMSNGLMCAILLLACVPGFSTARDRYYREDSKEAAYRAGYDEGYRDGLRHGSFDFRAGARFNYRSREYDNAGGRHGYSFRHDGHYKKGYKEGYREGYRRGYNSSWFRDRRHPRGWY